MYIKIAECSNVDGKLHLEIIRDITQEEIDLFYEKQKPVYLYIHTKNLHSIAIANANSLVTFLNNVFSNDSSVDKMKGKDIYLESNRLLANYCSSISMFIDQAIKMLSKKDEEKKNCFKQQDRKLYDDKFEYRFFKMLRHYILHYGLPFTRYYKSIYRGYGLVLARNHLLEYNGWKHVRNDLEQMDEEIDIRPYVKPMNVNLTIMLLKFLYLLSKEIVEALEECDKLLNILKVKAPAIVKYESIEEFKNGNMICTPINFESIKTAFDDLKRHPKINLNISDA